MSLARRQSKPIDWSRLESTAVDSSRDARRPAWPSETPAVETRHRFLPPELLAPSTGQDDENLLSFVPLMTAITDTTEADPGVITYAHAGHHLAVSLPSGRSVRFLNLHSGWRLDASAR